MIFKASLDTMAKVITGVITIIFTFVIIWPFFESRDTDAGYEFYRSAIVLISYLAAWAYSPRQYAITADALVIFRMAGNVVIPKSTIATAKFLDKGFPFAIRTFAVDGLFGYFGTFYNPANGKMTCYITNRNKCILVTTDKGKKIVISPDEKESFMTALQQ